MQEQGLQEFLDMQNRQAGIEKFRLAQIVWPPLKFDKSYQNVLKQLDSAEKQAVVIIYLKDSATSQEVNELMAEMRAVKGVKDVKFISKEESLAIYKERNKDHPALLELVTPNILPSYIDVYLSDFSVRDVVEQKARSRSFIEEVIQSL